MSLEKLLDDFEEGFDYDEDEDYKEPFLPTLFIWERGNEMNIKRRGVTHTKGRSSFL